MISIITETNGEYCRCLHNLCVYLIVAGTVCCITIIILIYMYKRQKLQCEHERYLLQRCDKTQREVGHFE